MRFTPCRVLSSVRNSNLLQEGILGGRDLQTRPALMTFAANEQGHLLASHIFPIMPKVSDISEGFSALLSSKQALKARGLLVFHLLWMLIDSYNTATQI